MKRIKEICCKLLRPGAAWVILFTVLSSGLLAFTFLKGLEESSFVYAIYVFSAYALVTLVINIPDMLGRIKTLLHENQYTRQYITDTQFREKTTLYLSLSVNLSYAIFQLIAGVIYKSFWYGAVAAYYAVICAVRFLLLYHFHKEERDIEGELRAYCLCGYLLFVLNVALAGVVFQMVNSGKGYMYSGFLIYAMAAYAFYRIIISIINIIKQHKLDSPVMSASKALNFAVALVAIFMLQTAMFAAFGGGERFQYIMNSVAGAVVCLIIFVMAIFMVRQGNRRLKNLEINN
ncbi:hypothetical protein [Alkaliphilus crotonatoxidans]